MTRGNLAVRGNGFGGLVLPAPIWPHDEFAVKAGDYLVRGVLQPQSLIVLFGDSGSGKSTLAIDLGMSIARGAPWRDLPTRRGLVLHVAAEGSRGVHMRVEAYVRKHDLDRDIAYAILPAAVQLGSHEATRALVPYVHEAAAVCGRLPALIIIDTLARSLCGSENEGEDMGRFIGACDALRQETDAAVMLVHHSGKDQQKGARGHSSLRAAADTELLVEGRANPRTLSCSKQRDLEPFEPMAFELQPIKLGVEDDGTNVTACVVGHSDHAPTPRKPTGKQQAALLAELERRYLAGAVAWPETELRAIGRELGMGKASARSAVVGLRTGDYLVASVGGATLKHPPEVYP